ncbi:MAG: B12-binding domain-containing radical SAM protein [Promethearchaeota archaeon]
MKVLFIHPNDYINNGIPSGVAILSAVLKQKGHTVDIFDFTFIKTEELPPKDDKEPSKYLPTEYDIEELVADDPVIPLEEAFKQKIKEFDPDLIAVSVMTGHFDKVINLLKKVRAKCKTIFGGVHPTISPHRTLQNDVVDFICIGDGEGLLIDLLEALEKGMDYKHIKNLGYKENGIIKINELRPFVNMDELPTPDWSLFDERHLFRPYMGNIYKGSFYIMSRGCPQICTYCVNYALRERLKGCGKYFRYQSPETTVNQLKIIKEKYGATWFKFADDSIMLFKIDYLEELAKGLKPLKINFGCSVRPENVTEQKIKLLKEMGMVAASVGIESGNERIRREVLKRNMTNELIINAIELLNKYNIRVSTFNMIGLPGETRENVFETIKLNKRLKVVATNVYIVYPYPNTQLNIKYNVNIYDDNGHIIPVSKASNFALSKMSPSEVDGLLRTFQLYVSLPEKMWPIIKIAEKSDKTANKLRKTLINYMVRET